MRFGTSFWLHFRIKTRKKRGPKKRSKKRGEKVRIFVDLGRPGGMRGAPGEDLGGGIKLNLQTFDRRP